MSNISPEEARAAILEGKVVLVAVGFTEEDPVLLHYLDRTREYGELMIYTEAIGGWSEGIKEAICEPGSDFYLEFVQDACVLEVTDELPLQREVEVPLSYSAASAPVVVDYPGVLVVEIVPGAEVSYSTSPSPFVYANFDANDQLVALDFIGPARTAILSPEPFEDGWNA